MFFPLALDFPVNSLLLVAGGRLADGASPSSAAVGADQRGGHQPGFPQLGEREDVPGHPRQEARHDFLAAQHTAPGLEGVGHPVGEAGHEASQLQVPVALLLQQHAEGLEEDGAQWVREGGVA